MLRSLARRVVDGLLLRRLPGPFVQEGGRCWVATLPGCADADPSSSPLTLYEDGVALRPARAALDDVRATGFGAYCHHGDRLYFSTSDNSNPNDSGRTYRFALSPWLYRRRVARFGPDGGDLTRPITLRRPDAGPERVRADVADALRRVEAPLEEAPLDADSIDLVISNAVLEHLYDLPRALAALWRITRPGGVGLHQVDHRDHRDFDRPLEYLLASDDDFRRLFDRCHGECGNRHRPDEVADAFRAAGLDVLDVAGNVFAEPAYLRRFLPRLRAARSRYRGWPAEGLRVVSAFFRVRRPSAP
jgi:SAM-dependent methyltransferase